MAGGKAPYEKGVRKERGFVNRARQMGQIAFRSAGSHSIIDVCIIDKKEKKIYFIQCKPNSISHTQRDKLIKEAGIDGTYEVKFGVA